MVFIPLLACSVAAAVASHYYAILILVPLGAGELTRTWIKRKVDIPMWLALSAGLLPILLFSQTILSAHGYSAHFWARPGWRSVPRFFSYLAFVINLILVAVAATILRRRRSADNVYVAKPIPLWQSVTFIMLVALPVVAMIVAKLVTHAYTERYALSAMLGGVILITWALCQVAQGRPVVAAALASICTINFVANSVYAVQEHHALRTHLTDICRALNRTGTGPIAVSDLTTFYQLSFYAPRPLAKRISYVADPKMSIHYLFHDTADRGLLDLRPWFPLRVVPLEEYVKENSSFVELGNFGSWDWLTSVAPQISKNVRLLERLGDRPLFFVENASVPAGMAAEVVRSTRPDLEQKYRSSPTPLCMLYFSSGTCPLLQ